MWAGCVWKGGGGSKDGRGQLVQGGQRSEKRTNIIGKRQQYNNISTEHNSDTGYKPHVMVISTDRNSPQSFVEDCELNTNNMTRKHGLQKNHTGENCTSDNGRDFVSPRCKSNYWCIQGGSILHSDNWPLVTARYCYHSGTYKHTSDTSPCQRSVSTTTSPDQTSVITSESVNSNKKPRGCHGNRFLPVRTTSSPYTSPSVLMLLLLGLLLSALSRPATAQCFPDKACNPEVKELVDLSFESRSLSVTSECGEDDSTSGVYRRSKTTLDDTDFLCETGSHPKEHMVDYNIEEWNNIGVNFSYDNARLDTYWQSENSVSDVNETALPECIVMDTSDPFLIRGIMAIFVSPHTPAEFTTMDMRPRAMVIEIKVGGDWKPVRYYAEDCEASFPGVLSEETEPNYNATTTVCKQQYYSTDESTFTGWEYGMQQVIFNPTTEFSPDFEQSADIQRYYTATGARLCMLEPADNFVLSSYYAVGDFEVVGDCSCFGHADSCIGVNKELCNCVHNTMGDHCEECQPLYNNKPWDVGHGNKSNACEDCGCNGHSLSCIYDPDKGYGVCDSCTDQTTGDKCQWCEDYYFVNPDKDTYNASVDPALCTALNGSEEITYNCSAWCIPCNCSQEGTVANEMACNNGTGQCSCKSFVEGRTCDQCMDGYWNLQEGSVDGCEECVCSEEGTVNGSLCDKLTGTCTCKDNVMGSDCVKCKPGTFNLSSANPEGCTSCDCDAGAATTATCNNQTGVCDCREGIEGRKCDQPIAQSYVPPLDYLTFEAEMVDTAEDYVLIERPGEGTVDTTLTGRGFVELLAGASFDLEVVVPRTFDYNVVVRYESSIPWTNFGLVFRAVNASEDPNPMYECAGETHDLTSDLYDSADLPAAESRGGVELSSRDMCLRQQTTYIVSISVPAEPPGGKILLDSIVLLPNYTLLDAYNQTDLDTQADMDTCYQHTLPIDPSTRRDLRCDLQEYSIMAEFFGQALPCFCDEGGSLSTVCEPYSGQCSCKPNVILQDCSQCGVGFYNFTSGEGCTACNCDPLGSLPRTCNESGSCLCQSNVIGEKCEECLPEHYGLASGEGCQPCTCNDLYSLNNSCMDDAQCHCKPGVGGADCDKCIGGAFNLTEAGCDLCGCDVSGSYEQGCDPEDGTCLCRRNVEGSKCDTCKEGFYGLGDWSPQGCLQCACSGHSTSCTSAPGYYRTKQESNWSLLDGQQAIEDIWTGTDELGDPVIVRDPVIIDNTRSQYVMRIFNSEEYLDKMLYFVATEMFVGNKQSAYNQIFNVTLGYFIHSPQTEDFVVEYINSTEGDVILKGEYTDYNLVARLPQYPVDTPTSYTFTLHEDQWRVNTLEGPNATYTQIISVLSNLGAIWVRAKYTNVTNSYSNLYEASIEFSTEVNATTEIPANNVEQCVCPEEYTGQFCEQCAPGYQRNPHNSGPYSECIPCACNNHGMRDTPCDPETGMCTCMNNTVGDHCELCEAGYYGDATDGTPEDCRMCMCPGNVILSAINVFADSCELKSGGGFTCTDCSEGHGGDRCEYCLEHYYGTPEILLNNKGACSACECNGRADTCNSTTGMCIDCRNNTAGKECDICTQGYYGDAMDNSCQPCDCTAVGATGQCDPSTGQCECHPNVLGFLCEGPCAPNTFNYSSGKGCEACDCHTEGATAESCDVDSGQCLCRDHVVGRQCDQCEDTYWNITPFGCSACRCTQVGTLNDTTNGAVFGTCELDSGQCQCALPGIIGRTCDQCATGTLGVSSYQFVTDVYIGAYPHCELCGECYDNWARKIDDVGLNIEELHSGVLVVWASYDNLTTSEVEPTLDQLREELTGVTSSIQMAQDMVDSLTYLQDGFDQAMDLVENLTTVLTGVLTQYTSVQQLLDSIQAYDGSIWTDSGSSSITPAQINQGTLELLDIVEQEFQAGNRSYLQIQRMSNIIASSSTLVQELMNDVSVAMQQVGSARLTRETAAILLSGTFAQSFSANAEMLENLQGNLVSVNSDIEAVDTLSSENEAGVEATNSSVHENLELTQSKMTAIEQMMAQAQSAKANVSEAEATVVTAVGEVRNYRNTAVTTKQTSQYLIEQIVLENQKVPHLNVQKRASQTMVEEIDGIVLQSLNDMEELVSQINGTEVSQAAVNEMLTKANTARQTAEQAQSITEQAEQESQMTLEYVRQINSNLQEGLTANDTVISDLDRSGTTVSLVLNTMTEVQSTIDNATSLAVTTEESLTSVEGFIVGVSQCFTDKTRRIDGARETAESAERFIEQVTSLHSESADRAEQASVQITQLSTLTENAYDLVVTAQDEMDSLQAQMDALEEVTTLQALYNDMVSQLIQMELLERDLSTCETEIDTLLTSLTALQEEPEVTCTHN